MIRRSRSLRNAESLCAGIKCELIRDSRFEIRDWEPAGKSLSIETEIKVKIEDVEDFCLQLNALNPDVLAERHFEDNYLLDFPDGKLQSGRCLLRIRFAEGMRFPDIQGTAAAGRDL